MHLSLMRLLDHSFDAPEQNLALDEVLLDGVETGLVPSTLRFWESHVPFVVLGTGQQWAREVDRDACERDGVPITRRCSAGGAVLQGPGCLNYTLAMSFEAFPQMKELRASYCHVLNSIRAALLRRGIVADHAGTSDLAVNGMKVSGNAQKRRRHAILHHGTLLYGLDPDTVTRYLKHPSDEPDYRGQRPHSEFIESLPLDACALREVVCEAFDAVEPPVELDRLELDLTMRLAAVKYGSDDWTFRR